MRLSQCGGVIDTVFEDVEETHKIELCAEGEAPGITANQSHVRLPTGVVESFRMEVKADERAG